MAHVRLFSGHSVGVIYLFICAWLVTTKKKLVDAREVVTTYHSDTANKVYLPAGWQRVVIINLTGQGKDGKERRK